MTAETVPTLDRIRTVTVGDLPVAVLDRRQTAELTISAALERRGDNSACLFFTTANGQVISLCAADARVRALYRAADLISADGMSVVFASRLLCPLTLPERVATTDAFHDAAVLAERRAATFYFLGAEEEMNRLAVTRARELYPKLNIVGRRHGYVSEDDEHSVADEINAAAPDVLWVGMGVPRQQEFVVRNRSRMTRVGVVKTCGGLFDFLSGKSSRAPEKMQRAGLEWLYRAANDPRRLAWRYFTTNPHALYVMLRRSGR